MMNVTQAFRGSILYFTGDPQCDDQAVVWHEDGLLLLNGETIVASGAYASLRDKLPEHISLTDYSGKLIMPGFVDTHVHYPQTDIIASPAEGLLPWLETYTFPAESQFGDHEYAQEVAAFFLDELLKNGTTTAMVYSTVHKESADAFFGISHQRNLRMVTGKVLMDRNCPDYLQDTAESGARDSEDLIRKWHGRGRQLYALTPRFAPCSTNEQLGLTGELARQYPDTFIQTHVAENKDECAWARSLFPSARSYLDIYDQFGLMRERAMYAHCIWLDETDTRRMAETGSAISVCPTSNLFLGSGLFDFSSAEQHQVRLSIATDVGGGTSFSMLQTMNEMHKVARMGGYHLNALRMFYYATLGGAKAMQLEHQIGTLQAGTEADFIVLNPKATQLLSRRTENADSLEEMLFAIAMLGDDRTIEATYAAGIRQK
ncbi:guanine deaminase [Undibacterium luofuense]|uniref:Guanine deaminase n=1 Tax=Undibacterium luofuense TaxID=2828733 RepID=A0A941DNM7_9BURK|nr:guanine deaminase [Undibacterium luofuense]MBR7784143.1 guanine deaminase [Undibacterium luofuense]